MKLRERVLAALDYQETDVIPYSLPIEDKVAARLDAHYGGPDWRQRVQDHIAMLRLPALGIPDDVPGIYSDPFGSVWRGDRRPAHLERPALIKPDLSGYAWPDLDALWDEAHIQQQLQVAQARGRPRVETPG